jgi:hypothetical protein
MDAEEKLITLQYLQRLLAIKKEDLGTLIDTLNKIYSGKSGVSLTTVINDLYVKTKEMGSISNQIEDLKRELEDAIPGYEKLLEEDLLWKAVPSKKSSLDYSI